LVGLNLNVLTSTDHNGRTALQLLMDALHWQECSFENFKQSAMTLARQKADITKRSTSGAHPTLLHILARKNENGVNNNELAELVQLNPNILTSKDNHGRTALQSLIDALHWEECSFENFKQSARVLAEQGANLSLQGTAGSHNTLLHVLVLNHIAENNGQIDALIALNNNVINFKDGNGQTPVHSLLSNNSNVTVEVFNRLLSATNLNLKDNQNATLLHAACCSGNLAAVEHLFGKGLHNVVNFKDDNGQTPVHLLLSNNSNVTIEALDKLLSATNLNLKDNQNATLLHAACRSRNLPAVKHLFGKGLSLTALTNHNETLIHYAVSLGNMALIQWLIDTKQIDINAKDQSGETALHRATRQNNHEVVELLTRNGADLTIKNNDGQRAHEIAIDMECHDLVPYLFNPKDEVFQKIRAMHSYGELLRDQGVSKGKVAIDLASKLMAMADQFFKQEPAQRNFAEFEPRFSALLHSKDQEMCAYRIAWGTIVANIAIALTGVGLFFIAGKLIHSKATQGHALFFFQKSKTTSEEKIADLEESASLIAQSA
jgi:ankyrin repeat protein